MEVVKFMTNEFSKGQKELKKQTKRYVEIHWLEINEKVKDIIG